MAEQIVSEARRPRSRRRRPPAERSLQESAPPSVEAQEQPSLPSPAAEARPRRRHRGGRGRRRRPPAAIDTAAPTSGEGEAIPPAEPQEPPPPAPSGAEARPRRRHRGGRGRRRRPAAPAEAGAPAVPQAEAIVPASVEAEAPPPPEATAPQPARRRGGRGRRPRPERAGVEAPAPEQLAGVRFAHPSEAEFARILDFYGIDWQYEPRSFPLRWEQGRVAEAFTPDFYLPDLNLYIEVTTLKTGLTADKNRKVRLLKQLYPEVNIRLLKKRDLLRLLTKYGYGPLAPEEVPDIDRILIPTTKLQQRVAELGAQISRDYADKDPVLIGVLRGVLCFLADLIRQLTLPVTIDFMAISSYEGDSSSGAVKILKDLDENIKGRHAILVEDIVDTGMTLNHILDYLWAKKPASLTVCALLDKRARRLVDVQVDYVGFDVPDQFVVGYGLDFRQRYRNLPFIAVLKHELLP